MNYSEMTDLEINKAVAGFIYPGKEFTAAYSFGFPLGPQVQWIQGYGEFLRKDYCNSWGDAGPIIAKHQICIIFDADSIIDPPSHWVMCRHVSVNGDVTDYYDQPDRPLRAAMIVFLMMQEGACAN